MTIKHNSKNYQLKLVEHMYSKIPAFTDIFTEESFYVTVVCFVLSTILIVFILSKFIVIKPAE